MLRLLILALVLANTGYWAYTQGLLTTYGWAPPVLAEPERLNQQIHPEAMRLRPPTAAASAAGPAEAADDTALPTEPAASAPAALASPATAASPASAPSTAASAAATTASAPATSVATACWQAGVFSQSQVNTLRERFNGQVAAEGWQFVPGTIPGAWLVYMGKYPSEDALAKKRLELRGLGLSVERLDSPALAPGLSLGSFPTQAAAQAALSKAEQRGVRTARVLQERADLAGFWLKLPAADAALKSDVDALLSGAVPGKRLQACR